MNEILDRKRLSWEEIKRVYPGQNVGLVSVEKKPNSEIVLSGIVKYTDKDMSYDNLALLAMKNEITLRYTTIDEDTINEISRC